MLTQKTCFSIKKGERDCIWTFTQDMPIGELLDCANEFRNLIVQQINTNENEAKKQVESIEKEA